MALFPALMVPLLVELWAKVGDGMKG
jgi:hypothetical protein